MRNLPLLLVRVLPALVIPVLALGDACTSGSPASPDTGSGSGSGSGSGATCNNMGICKPGEPNMCSLGSQGSGPACTGQTYDYCNTGSDCTSGMCHFFQASGFSVCVVTCQPGNNATCPGG